MPTRLVAKLCTAVLLVFAAITVSTTSLSALSGYSYHNGDPDCPVVTYVSGGDCVTAYEECKLECEAAYYHQIYPGCTVAPGQMEECANVCRLGKFACFGSPKG